MRKPHLEQNQWLGAVSRAHSLTIFVYLPYLDTLCPCCRKKKVWTPSPSMATLVVDVTCNGSQTLHPRRQIMLSQHCVAAIIITTIA